MNKTYSIEALTEEAYSRFPEARRKPVIGMTGNHSDIDVSLRDAYHKQIVAAGGVPVIIPPVNDVEVVANTLDSIDALILTGGGDYDPRWCGEEASPLLGNVNAVRDPAELLITRLAYNRNVPMLGICRGMQTLAMALGGHVAQDISERDTTVKTAVLPVADSQQSTEPIQHSQAEDRPVTTHRVRVSTDSILYDLYKTEELPVNSFHHQCVDSGGERFRIVATATDGVPEAMESTEHRSIMGVQWHPEWLGEQGLPIFQWLVRQADIFMHAKALHGSMPVLDTHCDTPMFFHQGVDFLKRDPRILVDLHKMTDGRQDATFMVCYLPQPKEGKTFRQSIEFPIDSPRQYADFIFDEIGKIVNAAPQYVGFARSGDDIISNKQQGKKSIVLGIENGLALREAYSTAPLTPEEQEQCLRNLEHFADRGVAYVTLCHNGDNDICDAASRSNNTHGGVSPFGERVIHRMNDLGIMVDLSHGGEKSFYDAIDISRLPIVCSHSNCRALCDHQRNLTDDQLRALARKGGVAHTTFYHGFLKKEGEASILDGIAHLEHAIKVMGIEHVGIGTDFDGDGGVAGMSDASDMINFTMHLLRKRFSDEDIRLIWGGNWLRVMRQVQESKTAV